MFTFTGDIHADRLLDFSFIDANVRAWFADKTDRNAD